MKVLVVDDNQCMRELISVILCSDGFEVVEAASGEDALEVIREGNIDLLVTDWRMPGGMSGDQLVEMVRTMKPQLKVVLMTGADPSELRNRVDVFLKKPFEMNVLLDAVGRLLKAA